jgi:methylmalonyl-CoA mutase, N-terminal domain
VSKKRRSSSGLIIERLYGDRAVSDQSEDAGVFPYTRGIHPDMYRSRLWTMRQYAGFGTAAATNERFRELLEAGQTGLSVAFDLPTQMGLDSDAAIAEGEVGRAGVAIDTVDDLAVVFDGIPLDSVSTSMTINATAAILLAMYIVVAEERGIDRTQLRGTLQNDVLKEYIARGTYIFPLEPSLRLATDILEFVAVEGLPFNPISVSGYHMREAGSTAIQEVAFTFGNAIEYLDRAVARQLDVNDVAPRLSFFFAAHSDLFEEVAKFRAARRLWATLVRERYDGDDRSCQLRFHTQTGGSTLTAQQPLNNVVRVTVQALAAVLGGTQSLHTNGFDEALALPSADAARLALRTQQIIAYESGVTQTVDPLGGSYAVEHLTDAIEAGARELLGAIAQKGGSARAVQDGFIQDAIARSAYRYQRSVESGETVIVGVNKYTDGDDPMGVRAPDYVGLADEQMKRLRESKAKREKEPWRQTLAALTDAARGTEPLMPLIIEAVRARASVGEICDALRSVWGTYRAAA